MKMIKLLLKLAAILLIVVVVMLMTLMKILLHLSSYVLGSLILILIAGGIYTIMQVAWNQLIIFTLMFVICALVLFGVVWVMVTLEIANDNLRGFVRG